MPLPTDSNERNQLPMCDGLLDYFPDALAAVSQLSLAGNAKHNPGQPLHWARDKSTDHQNKIVRHLIERGGFDTYEFTLDPLTGAPLSAPQLMSIRHSTMLAWRALALLQEEIERDTGAPPSRASRGRRTWD
jgi:hypothetical protein